MVSDVAEATVKVISVLIMGGCRAKRGWGGMHRY